MDVSPSLMGVLTHGRHGWRGDLRQAVQPAVVCGIGAGYNADELMALSPVHGVFQKGRQ